MGIFRVVILNEVKDLLFVWVPHSAFCWRGGDFRVVILNEVKDLLFDGVPHSAILWRGGDFALYQGMAFSRAEKPRKESGFSP